MGLAKLQGWNEWDLFKFTQGHIVIPISNMNKTVSDHRCKAQTGANSSGKSFRTPLEFYLILKIENICSKFFFFFAVLKALAVSEAHTQ